MSRACHMFGGIYTGVLDVPAFYIKFSSSTFLERERAAPDCLSPGFAFVFQSLWRMLVGARNSCDPDEAGGKLDETAKNSSAPQASIPITECSL